MTATSIPTTAQPTLAARSSSGRWLRLIRGAPLHIAIVLICLVWITPTVGLLISSFRPSNLVATTGWWEAFKTPIQFTLDNYQQVLTQNNMGPSFLNSLMISIPSTVIPILIAAFAAYAFAWMEFPGRQTLFVAVVGLLVVPLQMTLIPVLTIYTGLHITGTFYGVWRAPPGSRLRFSLYL